jgi:NAD(P)-dependent dehydrogenase (short-subunit alcohol dehydrogenase family)
MSTEHRVVVITGAGQGIGHGLAEAFHARGCRVAVLDREQAKAQAAAASLSQAGGADVMAVGCDVTDEGQVTAAWEAVCAQFGRVDLWVNNAGRALGWTPILAMDSADFRRMLEVNLLGLFHAARTAFKGMIAQGGGAIYNITGAGAAGEYTAGMTGYATTKRAVQFFTESLAIEARDTPVIIGAVSPGLVLTEGFFREHAKTPPDEAAAREAVVNLIGDHVETFASWAAEQMLANKESGRTFPWLTADKIEARRRDEPGRDVLSRYRRPDGSYGAPR